MPPPLSSAPTLVSDEERIVRNATHRKLFKDLTPGNFDTKKPYYFLSALNRADRSKLKPTVQKLLAAYDAVGEVLNSRNMLNHRRSVVNNWMEASSAADLKSRTDVTLNATAPLNVDEYNEITNLHKRYKAYVTHLKTTLQVETGSTAKRDNILGVTIDKIKSPVKDVRNWYREVKGNYYNMSTADRRKTLIFGVLAIGAIMKTKAGTGLKKLFVAGAKVIGVGLGLTYLSKLGTGKFIGEHGNAFADRVENIHEHTKDQFGIPPTHNGDIEARNLMDFFVMCGNRDFEQTARSFLKIREIYNNSPLQSDEGRKMDIIGSGMPGEKIYAALATWDRSGFKLQKLVKSIAEDNKKRAIKGEPPLKYTVANIMTMILMHKAYVRLDSKGKPIISRFLTSRELGWNPSNSTQTTDFWQVGVSPYSHEIKSYTHKRNLDKLCNVEIPKGQTLEKVIKTKHVVPPFFQPGFLKVSEKMKKRGNRVGTYSYKDAGENAAYAISKIKIGYGPTGTKEEYQRAAVIAGFQDAKSKLGSKYTEAVKVIFDAGSKHCYVLARSPLPQTSSTNKNSRGSLEHKLKSTLPHQVLWPEGNAVQRLGTKLIDASKPLTLVDLKKKLAYFRTNGINKPYNTLQSVIKQINDALKNKYPTAGIAPLTEADTTKIDGILSILSQRYSNVLSYHGLAYYITMAGYFHDSTEMDLIKSVVK